MSGLRELLRAPHPVDLAGIDPRATPGLPGDKDWAKKQLDSIGADLAGLQEKLYATTRDGADRRRLLLVLQAMDSGGQGRHDHPRRRRVQPARPAGDRLQEADR